MWNLVQEDAVPVDTVGRLAQMLPIHQRLGMDSGAGWLGIRDGGPGLNARLRQIVKLPMMLTAAKAAVIHVDVDVKFRAWRFGEAHTTRPGEEEADLSKCISRTCGSAGVT